MADKHDDTEPNAEQFGEERSNPGQQSWKDYYILEELKALKVGQREMSSCVRQVQKDVADVKTDVAALKVKAGLWGIAGGTLPVALLLLVWLLKALLMPPAPPAAP